MRTVVFGTAAEMARGLQQRPAVEPDTLFVFPSVSPGAVFHSRNVPEPFDLAFLDEMGRVLDLETMTPPDQVSVAPPGTAWAVEARAGTL